MGHKVVVDGMELDIPTSDRCWDIYIFYACGCRVTEEYLGMRREKTVRVKKDNHSKSCLWRRCVVGTDSHKRKDMCRHCEMEKARKEGAPVR